MLKLQSMLKLQHHVLIFVILIQHANRGRGDIQANRVRPQHKDNTVFLDCLMFSACPWQSTIHSLAVIVLIGCQLKVYRWITFYPYPSPPRAHNYLLRAWVLQALMTGRVYTTVHKIIVYCNHITDQQWQRWSNSGEASYYRDGLFKTVYTSTSELCVKQNNLLCHEPLVQGYPRRCHMQRFSVSVVYLFIVWIALWCILQMSCLFCVFVGYIKNTTD